MLTKVIVQPKLCIQNMSPNSQITYYPAAAASVQSCPTLCNPIDGSPPGSPIPGILQARTLAWVAISFSNAWKWKVKVKSLSCVRSSVTPWTAAFQAPPSMGFSRQEYWSGVPLPSLPITHLYLNSLASIASWMCSADAGYKVKWAQPYPLFLTLPSHKDTWSNSQLWPWSIKWSRAKANRVFLSVFS